MPRPLLVLLALLMFIGAVHAGTQVLGVEIGSSQYDEVRARLKKTNRIEEGGINKYSMGPMFTTDGRGYKLPDVKSVDYIFDAKKILSVVSIEVRKQHFDFIHKSLADKYPVQDQTLPFVGDKYARYISADNVIIVLSAKHLAFNMRVTYFRADFYGHYFTEQLMEDQKKNKEASGQL
jgi:hypothetical protein